MDRHHYTRITRASSCHTPNLWLSRPVKPCLLKSLPNEVICRILHYLDIPDRHNASATGWDFFILSDSLAFIADVPKFPIVRRCDPRPEDGIREQRLDNESCQRHRILDTLLEPRRAENLKSFALLERTNVPISEPGSEFYPKRQKPAVFRDYSRLQTRQTLCQLLLTAHNLEHLYVGFPLPVQLLHLIAEKCGSLRTLEVPLCATLELNTFTSLRALTILDADLESASLSGSNGVVYLALNRLDTLSVHVRGFSEPGRWSRRPWTRISLDGFPMLQNVRIFSEGPFSPHDVFDGRATTVRTLVIDGPFEFHYATQLRAFFQAFRFIKSLSVCRLRFWYKPIHPGMGRLPQIESLEVVDVDPRYFSSPELKLTHFRMFQATGLGDLGGVIDLLLSSLTSQTLHTLSLCLPGRLPLDSAFVNLISSTNVTLKHLQLVGKKSMIYEDRWRLLRDRLIPSLETAHVQGAWLPDQLYSNPPCGISRAGEDVFYRHGKAQLLGPAEESLVEHFTSKFVRYADPTGHFALAWGIKSPELSVGDSENHVRYTTTHSTSLTERNEGDIGRSPSPLMLSAPSLRLPYGAQYQLPDVIDLT